MEHIWGVSRSRLSHDASHKAPDATRAHVHEGTGEIGYLEQRVGRRDPQSQNE